MIRKSIGFKLTFGVVLTVLLAIVIFAIENPPAAGFGLLLIVLSTIRLRRIRVRTSG